MDDVGGSEGAEAEDILAGFLHLDQSVREAERFLHPIRNVHLLGVRERSFAEGEFIKNEVASELISIGQDIIR